MNKIKTVSFRKADSTIVDKKLYLFSLNDFTEYLIKLHEKNEFSNNLIQLISVVLIGEDILQKIVKNVSILEKVEIKDQNAICVKLPLINFYKRGNIDLIWSVIENENFVEFNSFMKAMNIFVEVALLTCPNGENVDLVKKTINQIISKLNNLKKQITADYVSNN